MDRSPDVIVVGGGVIGCAIAYELAKGKARVTLLERELVGSGASHASAGLLAPLSDTMEHPALSELGMKSLRQYRSFLQEVHEAGGLDVECISSGILRVALTSEEEEGLQETERRAKDLGVEVHWLGGREAIELEPLLAPSIRGALYSPSEPQLNPSRLVEALRRAALAHGAVFREQTPVLGLLREGSRVAGVRLADEVLQADRVVLATGSWACEAGDWLGMKLPVHPVRGQVVYVNKLARPLRHTVMRPGSLAVPKGDGTTLVGTTLEQAGFAPRVTVGGVASILTRIQELVPSIGETTINHTRAGLRPCSADHLPVLGPAPGAEEVVLAAGHYRSGILLAPVTATIIARLILEGSDGADSGPFAASRLERSER